MILGNSTNWDISNPIAWIWIFVVLVTAFLIRNLKYQSFSRWVAPIIGALVCGLMGFKAAKNQANPWNWMLGGIVFGFVCGLFICLLDSRRGQKLHGENLGDPEQTGESIQLSQSPLVGRSLAILTLIIFYIPFISLVMGIFAICLNWRCGGWPRIVSVLGAALALCVSVLVLIQLV